MLCCSGNGGNARVGEYVVWKAVVTRFKGRTSGERTGNKAQPRVLEVRNSNEAQLGTCLASQVRWGRLDFSTYTIKGELLVWAESGYPTDKGIGQYSFASTNRR